MKNVALIVLLLAWPGSITSWAQEELPPPLVAPGPLASTPPTTMATPPADSKAAPAAAIPQRMGSVRIKDIAFFAGQRSNKLTGMGLVTGLNGTGGKTPITRQYALAALERFGQRADPSLRANIRNEALDKTDNLSVVVVTAEIDHSQHEKGSKIDVWVSTFDDASNLAGGNLMMTPLYGVDGEVYAVASGLVSTGGFSFSGDAASVSKNHPTTGRIPNGATIEKDICKPEIGANGLLRLRLRNPDLETASRIVAVLNGMFPYCSRVQTEGTVEILIPRNQRRIPHEFAANISALRVVPDVEAKVVINERTGVVVIGHDVRLGNVAITHGSLSVVTGENPQVSQPAPLSTGETAVVPRTDIEVREEEGYLNVLQQNLTVGELAANLNALGVTPRDLGSIFQTLRSSGALHANLEFQ